MNRCLVTLAAVAIAFFAAAPIARACDDNSDQVMQRLKKVDLTTEQLKQVFAYQNDHKNFITKAHKEGLGCRSHESNVAVFEKSAVGILSDDQFKKYSGRERNETETLRYQNYLLKQEIDKLKKEIESLKKPAENKSEAKPAEKKG
ncbi:MAG: hypothetical protein ACKVS6_00600 [Planctomycetota bacterium]